MDDPSSARVESAESDGSSFQRRTGLSRGAALAVLAGYWLAIGALDALTDGFNARYWDLPGATPEMWRDRIVWFGSWILFTPAVLVVVSRAHPRRIGWPRAFLAHLAIQAVLVAAHSLLASAVFLGMGATGETLGQHWTRMMLTVGVGARDLAVYWGQIALFYALSYRERVRRDQLRLAELAAESADLSRLLTEAKLEALRRELNPHLLFNALNSVSTLIRDGDRRRASRMIAAISDLLRSYLGRSGDELVSVPEELELVDRYLEVERLRLEDRLAVRISVDPQAMEAALPPFLLQPIVENAIRHGATSRGAHGVLDISVSTSAESLWIRVIDGVAPVPADGRSRTMETSGPASAGRGDALPPTGHGVGLSNTKRRLATLFGDRAGVSLEVGAEGACTTAWLPIHATHRTPALNGAL